MPDVIIAHPLNAARGHPDHEAAKAGDVEAAYRLARDLVSDELAQQVADAAGLDAIIIPVAAVEISGNNKIPHGVATEIAARCRLRWDDRIVQAARVDRGGASGLDRIFKPVPFSGEVQSGASYVPVDDTLTQGGTFAGLAAHIESRGGRVVAVVALTGKQYSRTLTLSDETLCELRERHGDVEDVFRHALGYVFDSLTESEARYLARCRPADAVRDRILAEGK